MCEVAQEISHLLLFVQRHPVHCLPQFCRLVGYVDMKMPHENHASTKINMGQIWWLGFEIHPHDMLKVKVQCMIPWASVVWSKCAVSLKNLGTFTPNRTWNFDFTILLFNMPKLLTDLRRSCAKTVVNSLRFHELKEQNKECHTTIEYNTQGGIRAAGR